MTDNAESRPTADGERLRIARIYFRHRTETRRPGLIGWLFPTSTPRVLAERALEAGALHASFLRANTRDLADTTVVLLDGVVFRTVTSAP